MSLGVVKENEFVRRRSVTFGIKDSIVCVETRHDSHVEHYESSVVSGIAAAPKPLRETFIRTTSYAVSTNKSALTPQSFNCTH
jgi:hypothetical protein